MAYVPVGNPWQGMESDVSFTSIPVSYTHLDVYKRQALNTDLVCDAINTAMRELFLQIVYGRTPVSYTHLDVYKRQTVYSV